jgi:polysaccharide biosynthesis/export protein
MAILANYYAGSLDSLGFRRLEGLRHLVIRGLLLAFLVIPAMARAEEYRLAPGDVLRVMIVGNRELTLDVPIEMDGFAWFPLVGPIVAGGETLHDVRSRTAEAYVSMSLSRPVVAGSDLSEFLVESQVYVTVASYRPIYITGDVGTVHEIPYRTGMTIRHLLALASSAPPSVNSSQATPGEVEAAATALAHEYAQIWRQKSFLGTVKTEDYDRIFVTRGTAFDELVAVEQAILDETRADIEVQKQQLRDEVARVKGRIAVLTGQKDNEAEGMALDEKDLATVQDLFNRNLVPASRLTEVRRSTLVTASRLFQIEVALESARGQAATLETDILAVDSNARARAWADLGDAITRVQQRKADLESLLSTGGASPLAGLTAVETRVIVTRGDVVLPAEETTPSLALMPGDIVEVRRLAFSSTVPDAEVEVTKE